MTTLHDELAGLTAEQPMQPGDRLGAVTGKARRIRRRRAAASGLAVVTIAAIGAGVVQAAKPAPVRYTATPLTQWQDRSEPSAKDVGYGAFDSWWGTGDAANAHVRWLYRGVVPQPDGTQEVVADFIATKDYVTYLVQGRIDRNNVDDNGTVVDPSQNWQLETLDLATLKTAPSRLQHVIGTVVVDLESPSARQVRWSYSPLPFAPSTGKPTAGTLGSENGVFTLSLGRLTGPLTITDQAGRAHPVEPVDLRTPEAFSPHTSFINDDGTGTTSKDDQGRWQATSLVTLDRVTGRRSVDIRCYGGGRMTATIRRYIDGSGTAPGPALASGAVACDGGIHQAVAQVRVSGTGYEVELTGDRLQAYAFRVTKG